MPFVFQLLSLRAMHTASELYDLEIIANGHTNGKMAFSLEHTNRGDLFHNNKISSYYIELVPLRTLPPHTPFFWFLKFILFLTFCCPLSLYITFHLSGVGCNFCYVYYL